MKSVEKLYKEICDVREDGSVGIAERLTPKKLYELLHNWGLEIIEECTVKAQILVQRKRNDIPVQISLTWYEIDSDESIHVDRETIERVKDQL